MSGAVAVVGALAGVAVWGAAGAIAAKSAYEAAASEQQRQVLRQLFRFGGPYAAVLMALAVLVGVQGLPTWLYVPLSLCWFGALLPALAWAHGRLDQAAPGAGLDAAPAAHAAA